MLHCLPAPHQFCPTGFPFCAFPFFYASDNAKSSLQHFLLLDTSLLLIFNLYYLQCSITDHFALHRHSRWLCCKACGILAPWPGIEPVALVVEAQSPNHWTVREFSQTQPLDVHHSLTLFSLIHK